MSVEFGKDPMDLFSVPVSQRDTKLSRVFAMDVRANAEKPGRSLAVVWDERASFVEGFENRYSYVVSFSESGNMAGNHFHKEKEELFYPLLGEFTVFFEDVQSGVREEIVMKTEDHEVLFVPKGIAHTVRAETDHAILLVVASAPNVEGDEFSHTVLP